MSKQRTLIELKRLGREAFADAQDAIHTAKQISRNCRLQMEELRRSREEFRQFNALPPRAMPPPPGTV